MEDQIIIPPQQVSPKDVNENQKEIASGRFRGYYPVAVDVETGIVSYDILN